VRRLIQALETFLGDLFTPMLGILRDFRPQAICRSTLQASCVVRNAAHCSGVGKSFALALMICCMLFPISERGGRTPVPGCCSSATVLQSYSCWARLLRYRSASSGASGPPR
jgi:hypothetical protein